MKKFSKAKVGDSVWCDRYGNGKINYIGPNRNTYPLSVAFKGREEETFTLDGFYNELDTYSSLYWNEQPFDKKNDFRPRVIDWNKVPKNTQVLVCDEDDEVQAHYYFFGYLPKAEYPFYACEEKVDESLCAESFEYCEIHPEEECKEEWYK